MTLSLTLIIIIVTAIVSITAFNNSQLLNKMILWPQVMNKPSEYYRLLTSGFIHADYMHLGFNMLTLYFFGDTILYIYGMVGMSQNTFLMLYLTGIIASSLPPFLKNRNNPSYRALGASGGVSAVLFSFVYFAPWEKIYLLGALGIPSIIAAGAYLAYSAYMSKKNLDNVGHDAHFYGAVYGFLFTLAFEPSHGQLFLRQLMNPHF